MKGDIILSLVSLLKHAGTMREVCAQEGESMSWVQRGSEGVSETWNLGLADCTTSVLVQLEGRAAG